MLGRDIALGASAVSVRSPRTAWPARAVLVAAVGVLTLAGCARPELAPREAASVVVPRTGECWQAEDDARTWSWWQGAGPVACTERHEAITVTVAELDEQFGYTISDEDPEQVDLSIADRSRIGELCDSAVVGVATGLRRGSRIETAWYLPRPEQWDAGARWLRCDISLRALGPLDEVTLEELPPSALAVIAAADEYRVCMDTPFPAEDYGPWLRPGANTLVDCDEPAQWEWGVEAALPDGPLPDRAEVDRIVRESCVPHIEYAHDRSGGWSYWPDAEGWDNGARTVRCWMR